MKKNKNLIKTIEDNFSTNADITTIEEITKLTNKITALKNEATVVINNQPRRIILGPAIDEKISLLEQKCNPLLQEIKEITLEYISANQKRLDPDLLITNQLRSEPESNFEAILADADISPIIMAALDKVKKQNLLEKFNALQDNINTLSNLDNNFVSLLQRKSAELSKKIKTIQGTITPNALNIHDYVTYGLPPDEVISIPIKAPDTQGAIGLNLEPMLQSMTNILTDTVNFDLLSKNCSATTMTIINSGIDAEAKQHLGKDIMEINKHYKKAGVIPFATAIPQLVADSARSIASKYQTSRQKQITPEAQKVAKELTLFQKIIKSIATYFKDMLLKQKIKSKPQKSLYQPQFKIKPSKAKEPRPEPTPQTPKPPPTPH